MVQLISALPKNLTPKALANIMGFLRKLRSTLNHWRIREGRPLAGVLRSWDFVLEAMGNHRWVFKRSIKWKGFCLGLFKPNFLASWYISKNCKKKNKKRRGEGSTVYKYDRSRTFIAVRLVSYLLNLIILKWVFLFCMLFLHFSSGSFLFSKKLYRSISLWQFENLKRY